MMVETPELIERLARGAAPVGRLHPPLARAGLWLLLAIAVLALVGVEHGFRPHLAEQLHRPAFLAALCASGLTGVLAACGCLLASLPGRTRLWLLLPAPSLAVWISTTGYGCLIDGIRPGAMQIGEVLSCFATLLLVSIPLSLALFAMLRHVARLRPMAVTLTAGLAVAAMASTALSLFHSIDAAIMILIWNLGMAALVVIADGFLGRRLLLHFDEAKRAR